MDKIFYNSFNHPQTGLISVASLRDKVIFVGLNENPNYTFDSKSNLEPIKQIKEYLDKKRKNFDIEIEFLEGTDFQKTVWNKLLEIPYGKTMSYMELAQNCDCPNGFRAVGNANGKNPIPIIVPCHRVINANGKLGGYSGGIKVKECLLKIEGTL